MEATIVFVLFGAFLVLLLIGAPITVALGVAALASFVYLGENPIKFVQIAFTSVGSFPLMALPAFILAGALMEAAGISRRLVALAETFAGPVTGGISAATVFACLFFFIFLPFFLARRASPLVMQSIDWVAFSRNRV